MQDAVRPPQSKVEISQRYSQMTESPKPVLSRFYTGRLSRSLSFLALGDNISCLAWSLAL